MVALQLRSMTNLSGLEMSVSRRIRRVHVQQYKQSGRLVAAYRRQPYEGTFVIELSPNMKSISEVRNPKYVRMDSLSSTRYIAEIAEEEVQSEGGGTTLQFHLLRILSPEDLDLDRWTSTASLADLPVSPEENYMPPEELAWAGKRDGNETGGIVLSAVTLAAIWYATQSGGENPGFFVSVVCAAVSGWCLIRYPWRRSRPPLASKIEELEAHKLVLRQSAYSRLVTAETEFKKALGDYATWERLSPRQFEEAVSLRLKSQGFMNVKTTRFLGDGGVDIEAADNQGRPVIVQVKQHRTNVGVSVVREMIGVRATRNDAPRVIIYSLSGFSRGAKELAAQEDVELRDVRSELLRV